MAGRKVGVKLSCPGEKDGCGKCRQNSWAIEVLLVDASRTAQGLLHEPFLCEAGPPFRRLSICSFENFLTQSLPCLVPQLEEVLSHQVCCLWAVWPLVHSVQRETWISRDVKSGNGQAVHLLQSLSLAWTLLQLLQALCDVKGQVDENSVRLGLDLVRAEEDVCLEVVKRFVNYVRLFWCRQTRCRAPKIMWYK